MFDLSIGKLLILAVAALFVLGPERLPAAATWLARDARPLDDLRRDLAGVRTWRDPRSALIEVNPE